MRKAPERTPVSSIFISHNHKDKRFVRRIARDLEQYGIRVWVDEAELNIGDSLIQMVSEGIESSEYLAVVLSSHSVQSNWVKKELQIAMTQEIEGQKVVVLPFLLDDCKLPGFLVDKVYADFRLPDRYEDVLGKVLRRLGVKSLVPKTGERVCVLYAGGSIGFVHSRASGSVDSPRRASWDDFLDSIPAIRQLPYDIDFRALEPVLDSAEIGIEVWTTVAAAIEEAYAEYSGFVVMVSTDAMSYTASALSFMLNELDKPVIVTGADIPLGYPNTDASSNLIDALSIAAPVSTRIPVVPEVCICFGGHLLRGTRARRQSANGLSQFVSPEYPELGVTGREIRINEAALANRNVRPGRLYASISLDTSLVALNTFPGMNPSVIRELFAPAGHAGGELKALILMTSGVSQTKLSAAFRHELSRLVKRGILVLAVPQRADAITSIRSYEGASDFLDCGVITTLDMTPETAIVKAMYVLGQGWPIDECRRIMQLNLCGEQSVDSLTIELGSGRASPTCDIVCLFPGNLSMERILSASLRFTDVSVGDPSRSDPTLLVKPTFHGRHKTRSEQNIGDFAAMAVNSKTGSDPTAFDVDVLELLLRYASPGSPLSITIVVDNTSGLTWHDLHLTVYSSSY